MITEKTLLQSFSSLKPLLQSCSEDDRASDLRFVTTEFYCHFLSFVQNVLSRDQIVEFYVQVIARLDDAQDDIRIKSAEALYLLFKCEQADFSSGIKDYIVKTLLVHFDDSNKMLRQAIQQALLQFAVKIDKKMVREGLEESISKSRFNENAQELQSLIIN